MIIVADGSLISEYVVVLNDFLIFRIQASPSYSDLDMISV